MLQSSHSPATTSERADRKVWPHRRFLPIERPRGLRAAPLGLIGTLVLVAAIETMIGRAGVDLLDPTSLAWIDSARGAREFGPKCEILCFGDSLAKHGLFPRVITSKTGRSAYNLSMAAGPPATTFYLLRRALDAGARPSALILEYKPSLLAGGPRFRLRQWPELLDLRDSIDLILNDRKGSFAVELLLGQFLPSFRRRDELRINLLAALQGKTSLASRLNQVLLRNWSANFGGFAPTIVPPFDGRVSETQHQTLLSQGFKAQRINDRYVRRAVALAESYHIPTYLVVPPLAPALLERRAKTGAEAGFTKFLRSVQQEFPSLTVLDARSSRYESHVFADPTHLASAGAVVLSNDVGMILRADLEARDRPRPERRWISLPAFREVKTDVPIEEFEQSRLAVGITLTD